MVSGLIGCYKMKELKATLSIRPRLPHRAGAGGRRPTGSMAKRWFECCSPTSVANLGCARW